VGCARPLSRPRAYAARDDLEAMWRGHAPCGHCGAAVRGAGREPPPLTRGASLPPLGLPRASEYPRHWPARPTGISGGTTARRRTPAFPRTGCAGSLHAPWPGPRLPLRDPAEPARGPSWPGSSPPVASALPARWDPPCGVSPRVAPNSCASSRAPSGVSTGYFRTVAQAGAEHRRNRPQSRGRGPEGEIPHRPLSGTLDHSRVWQASRGATGIPNRQGTAHGTSPRVGTLKGHNHGSL
jgi:hypothetical protein